MRYDIDKTTVYISTCQNNKIMRDRLIFFPVLVYISSEEKNMHFLSIFDVLEK